LKEQPGDHYAGFAPVVGPVADRWADKDAGGGETEKHHADDERRAAELGHVKRQSRRQHGMLRVAEELHDAEQHEGARPKGVGIRGGHRS